MSIKEQGTAFACAMEGKTNDDSDDGLGAWIYNSSCARKALHGASRRTASNAPTTHKSERLVCEDQTSRTAHSMPDPNECSKKSNDDGLVASLINTHQETNVMSKRKLCVEKDDCPVKSSVAGCSNNAERGGASITHGEKNRIHEIAAMSALPIPRARVCSHDGCSKRVFSVQVCHLHDGSNVEAKPKKKPRVLDVSTRTISVSKDGLTLRYYKKCTHEGCESIAKKSGKCYSHGATRKICAVDGCTISSQKKGLCRRHFKANEEFAESKVGEEINISNNGIWDHFVNVCSEIS